MKILKEKVPLHELQKLAKETFGNLVKAVVDVEKQIMAIGGELHSDEEALLLEQGSQQRNLWGINLYPDAAESDWIEFDSLINIRPSQGNLSRSADDPQTREKITGIVNNLVER